MPQSAARRKAGRIGRHEGEWTPRVPTIFREIEMHATDQSPPTVAGFQELVEGESAFGEFGLPRALHSHHDRPFERYFGRLAIAQLPADTAVQLIARVEAAVTFWTRRFKEARAPDFADDHRRALDVLRLLLVALSRLTVRMSEDNAIRTFKVAVALAKDPDIWHNWLLEALIDLAKYAGAAVSSNGQGSLALDAWEFPLPSEKGAQGLYWGVIMSAVWGSTPVRDDTEDPRWSTRIKELIAATKKGQSSRNDASTRLLYLALRNALTTDERAAFGRGLWSDLDNEVAALPANTRIVSSHFAQLPTGDEIDAAARVQARLFEPDLRQVMLPPGATKTEIVQNKVGHLISLWDTKIVGLAIPEEIVARMFDEIVAWNRETPAEAIRSIRPLSKISTTPFGFMRASCLQLPEVRFSLDH
jgi:hypothetical protein